MARLAIPLPNAFYKSIAKNISSQEIINLYVIPSQESQKVASYLLATSGLEEFADFGVQKPIWGMKEFQGSLYVCCGDNIYTVSQSGVKTLIGNIGTVVGNVMFEENGTNLVVLKPTGDLWEVTTSGVTQITSPDLYAASSISQSFGFFILPITDSNEFQISDQDSITFSGFIAKTESSPDNIIRTIQNNDETYFFKAKSLEVWAYTGDVDFPYVRKQVLKKGAASTQAFAQEDNSIFWLGNDKKIYEMQGYQYGAISTEVIEQIIAEMNVINDAIFWTYIDGGQTFLTCQFPTENVTYEANLSVRNEVGKPEWHKRVSGSSGRWRANCFENSWGGNYVGDYQNGKVYKIVFNSTTEDGENIYRSFVTPYFFELDNSFVFDRIELDAEMGLGNSSGAGSAPVVYLSWSDDYGHTFSNQYPASLGRQGDYKIKAFWLGKGSASKRCFKFIINDPYKLKIGGIYADVQKLEV